MEPSIATIRVFVLSDVRFYREGLAEVLDTTGQITVLGTAAATEPGLRRCRRRPGRRVARHRHGRRARRQRCPSSCRSTKIVALAVPESEDELIRLVEAGVLGYVTREESLARS